MIVLKYDDDKITNELHNDLSLIKAEAKKKFKKQLLKIIASGITSKEYVFDYEVTTPNNNKWAVTTRVKANRNTPIQTNACCIVESNKNRDYLILRGTTYGGKFFVRVISHAISRMKERDKRAFSHIPSGGVCNRIFKPNESGFMFYTNKEDVEQFWSEDVKEDVNAMIVTSSGVYFGKQFKNLDDGACHIDIKTFVNPEKLATHEQHDMYRCGCANIQMTKHLINVKKGNDMISFIKKNHESERLMKIIEEYKNEFLFIEGSLEIPE